MFLVIVRRLNCIALFSNYKIIYLINRNLVIRVITLKMIIRVDEKMLTVFISFKIFLKKKQV